MHKHFVSYCGKLLEQLGRPLTLVDVGARNGTFERLRREGRVNAPTRIRNEATIS